MGNQYLKNVSSRKTPQSEAIFGRIDQVENSAGGHVWEVDKWDRLRRFLILGSESGSYYASEQKLTKENAECVLHCVRADGVRAVAAAAEVSVKGLAPKNDPAIFVLALAISYGNDDTKYAVRTVVPKVCRTATHLFQFISMARQHRGWGTALRKAVASWYMAQPVDKLAYQMVKYRQREGYTHRDALRQAHVTADTDAQNDLFRWTLTYGHSPNPEERPGVHNGVAVPRYPSNPGVLRHEDYAAGAFRAEQSNRIIEGFFKAQHSTNPVDTANLVTAYGLTREMVKPEHLNSPEVWVALLESMPLTAMVRNLGKMSSVGLLTPTSGAVRIVKEKLNADFIRRSRVHPIALLSALLTYKSGHGVRGKLTWNPVGQVIDALDEAFYLAFGNVKATGKRHLLALDVSVSMDSPWGGQAVAGVPGLTPRVASSAMAMVTIATGDPYEVVAFTSSRGWGHTGELSILPLSKRQRLDDICQLTARLPFGGTDCALPMLYATQEKREFDTFVIYTDSETWAGNIHPSQALAEYRQQSGINARCVVVGMVSNGFNIADPKDPGMLDVVGFDASAPQIISDFSEGLVCNA